MWCLAAVNVSILRTVSGDWVDTYLTPIKGDGFGAALALVILSAVAFVLVSVQPWMLQLLEGEHLPSWLARRAAAPAGGSARRAQEARGDGS